MEGEIKRHKSKSRRSKSLQLDTPIPELTILKDNTTSMSIDSSLSPRDRDKLSPTHIESVTRRFSRSCSGGNANQTGSRERLSYIPHKDGLLNKNTLPFVGVDFCFHCGHKPLLASDLIKCTEKTGYKLDGSGHIPVYRTVFLCVTCVNSREQSKSNIANDVSSCLRISQEALLYFQSSK